MNIFSKIKCVFPAILMSLSVAAAIHAQSDETNNFVFVTFETNVSRTNVATSDDSPNERRFYVSNVVAIPMGDPAEERRASKTADTFFTANLVEPLKLKGILHQYYDDAIKINDSVIYRLDTRAEVEALRLKVLEDLKGQNANVFTFTWMYGQKGNGLETTKPALFHRGPEQPLYGEKETGKPAKPRS